MIGYTSDSYGSPGRILFALILCSDILENFSSHSDQITWAYKIKSLCKKRSNLQILPDTKLFEKMIFDKRHGAGNLALGHF